MKRKSTTRRKPVTIPDQDSTENNAPDTSPGDVTQEVEAEAVVPDIKETPAVPEKKDDTRPVPVVGKRVLKNIYNTRVVVGADRTPSGTRYEFQPGQELPIEPEDYHFLLSLNRNPGPGCCGGTPAEQAQRHYFGIPD